MKNKLLGIALSYLTITATAHSGNWLEEILTSSPAGAADLSSGISASKTYTHLIDWNSDDGGAVVNGVTLIPGGLTGANYTFTRVDNFFQNSGNSYDPASGMFDLSEDFLFTSAIGPDVQTLTLTGLTGGATYTISHYQSSGWQGALQILDGDDDGLGFNTYTTDRGGTSPRAIRYTYTQAPGDTTFQMTFDAANDTDGFHHYAFTNEFVIPEPTSLGLLSFVTLGLFCRRRRRD